MKAAVKTAAGDFAIEEVSTPRLQRPDWVLARVRAAGICGTDLRSWKVPDPQKEGSIIGHELAGEVVETGAEVTVLRPGDRVVIETVLGDDTCPWCRAQQYNLCPHLYEVRSKSVSRAFAEYVAGPAKKFYRLPDHVSFEEGALLDTFSVGLHAVHVSGLKINDRVVVIGAGPIGLGLLELVRACGAEAMVTDILDFPLRKARELGAAVAVDTRDRDGHAELMEFTGGRSADITFECAGGKALPVTLPQAVSYTRIGGKVVMVGGFDAGRTAVELDWQHLQKAEIQLLPSASYSFWGIYPEMAICLDLLAAGKLDAKSLITHSFPLEKINEAFETAEAKEKTGSIFVALKM